MAWWFETACPSDSGADSDERANRKLSEVVIDTLG